MKPPVEQLKKNIRDIKAELRVLRRLAILDTQELEEYEADLEALLVKKKLEYVEPTVLIQ